MVNSCFMTSTLKCVVVLFSVLVYFVVSARIRRETQVMSINGHGELANDDSSSFVELISGLQAQSFLVGDYDNLVCYTNPDCYSYSFFSTMNSDD